MNELKDKVSEQRMVEIELRHIPGHENPADITSSRVVGSMEK
jgi:hypothetical protein